MATEANTHAALEAALANRDQAILLIMGDGEGFDEIVGNADHAILFPATQATVWVRDVSILTDQEREDYKPGDPKYVACALSRPPREVRARVSRPAAMTMIFMEALTAAQAEQRPPTPAAF